MVVVGHQVTQDGLEYLVKGARHPDISGIWTPRESVDSSWVKAYMRRQSGSPAKHQPIFRGVLPEDLGGCVRHATGNPYPISDQNM